MKDIHKVTCVSLDGQTMNQIYYTLTDRRQATSIINVTTYRKSNYNSEHYLVKCMHKASVQTRKQHYRKEKEKNI